MLHRILALFERYCAQNLIVSVPGPPLQAGRADLGGPDLGGADLGQVSHVARRGNRLEIAGRARAARVTLICGGERVTTAPQSDPANPEAPGRFLLDLPVSAAALRLQLDSPGQEPFGLDLRGPDAAQVRRARRALVPGFLAGVLRALPLILRWGLHKDPALRPRIRAALGLWVPVAARPLSPALFAPPAGGPPGPAPTVAPTVAVTCILPVYNAFDLLPEVLDRLLRHTDLPWHLVLIEDASPDPAVRPFLRDWVAARAAEAPGRVTLLENPVNLGFIGSVNRALAPALVRGGPVVLLNADTFVPAGWASRLIRPLLADPSVASATPMSNDAEIFSVPAICARSPLAPGQAEAIDAVARSFTPGAGDAPAPTGVGFCMALAEHWLAQVPGFDPAFAPGYGEEVDWCQKIRALGGRHLGVADLFVEHRGGASFGSEQKRRLIAINAGRISARYPAYDIEVQDHLRADPMITPRLALAVAWAGAQAAAGAGAAAGAVPIYLAHALAGGVEHYQRGRLEADIARLGAAVVLRVGGPLRWRLEVHAAAGVTMGETDDFALIGRLLAPLTRRSVIYSGGVSDPDPVTLPARLLELCAVPGSRLEVLFHDFFPLSPSFTLLGADGWFAGVPDAASRDPAHQTRRPDGTPVSLAEWRAAWGALITRADRLVVFSADSRAHVLAAWPGVAPRLEVVPHQLHHAVPRIAPEPGPRPVVGVLGNLNRHKGAAVVAQMARLLSAGPDDLGLVVIGDTDPSCPLGSGVTVQGEYRLEELPLLARRHRISAWLIPSVWPETFSYTTHEALATGLPVFCLDLGAQADAVRAAGAQGHVVARHPDLRHQAQMVLDDLRAVLAPAGSRPAR